jgi:hypothetical protein
MPAGYEYISIDEYFVVHFAFGFGNEVNRILCDSEGSYKLLPKRSGSGVLNIGRFK